MLDPIALLAPVNDNAFGACVDSLVSSRGKSSSASLCIGGRSLVSGKADRYAFGDRRCPKAI